MFQIAIRCSFVHTVISMSRDQLRVVDAEIISRILAGFKKKLTCGNNFRVGEFLFWLFL